MENSIICPFCKKEFPLADVITHQLEETYKAKFEQDYAKQAAELKSQNDKKVQAAEKEIEEKYKARYEKQQQEAAKGLEAVHEKEKALLEKERLFKEQEHAREIEFSKRLDAELEKKNAEMDVYRQKEKEALQKEIEHKEDLRKKEIEFDKKLAEEKKAAAAKAQEIIEAEYDQKLKEKQKVINDLEIQMKEAQKKAAQNSGQLQGETLELEIEDLLRNEFLGDDIDPVPKGKKGADIIQTVRLPSGKAAGKIIWELKRTKTWQKSWIDKLKEDQRDCQSELAIIASETLPDDVETFGIRHGIWITHIKYIAPLAVALRETLKSAAAVKSLNEGRESKAEMVFTYVSGTQFKQRVEAIVEAYSEMQKDLDAERNAMEKIWGKRRGQLERFAKNICGMYGDLQGIGAPLSEIKLLEMPE
ncbi:hypothetical protein AGMMS50212_04550 [Spirochaetia bacterium]|nr:hypothetical protein AGMMS50212_04550 [Spirochaetia bacterium]